MTQRPRDIGTAAESAVVRHLRDNGFPHAERRALHGSQDLGDITGTVGICWEVKGGKAAETASDGLVKGWLFETLIEKENASADYGILVMKRKGIGMQRAGEWWAVVPAFDLFKIAGCQLTSPLGLLPVRVHLFTVTQYLRRAGYGDRLAA